MHCNICRMLVLLLNEADNQQSNVKAVMIRVNPVHSGLNSLSLLAAGHES